MNLKDSGSHSRNSNSRQNDPADNQKQRHHEPNQRRGGRRRNSNREKAIPGMGKHLLFRRFRGVTDEGKKRINDKVGQDFDFESMNDKFSKIRLQSSEEIERNLAEEQSNVVAEHTGDVGEEVKGEDAMNSVTPSYDKTSSFFDNISSDLKDRSESQGHRSRMTHREEKKLNTETFGAIALSDNRRYRYRGRGGRGGYRNYHRGYRGRGRGGGYYNNNYRSRGRGRGRYNSYNSSNNNRGEDRNEAVGDR